MKTVKVIHNPPEWRAYCRNLKETGSVGFVPTMGALHQGHRALVERAGRENTSAVVSIFVNPTQFNDPKDLSAYPRTLEADIALLESAGAAAVFVPEAAIFYPDGYSYKVTETGFSQTLCGAFRPGHFDGVLTVVLKLLQLTAADRAYFGQKDYQQLRLISGMAEAFFLETAIIGCPTVREDDGLALSSRNQGLGPEARRVAPALYRALTHAPSPVAAGDQLAANGFKVEYVEEIPDPLFGGRRRLAAAWLEEVRLIDNVHIGGGS